MACNQMSDCNPFFNDKGSVRFSALYLKKKRNLLVFSSVDMIVMTSMVELESIFGHLFDELSNGENQVVSKSSAVTTADASDKCQQQQDSTSSTSTLATAITADGNFDFDCYELELRCEKIEPCYTQNRSIIHRRFNKTPYELINGKKPDISFLHVFGALCYPKNDREDIGKLGAKGDIGFFIGYVSLYPALTGFYNSKTKENHGEMNDSDLTYASVSHNNNSKPTEGELDLLFEAMYDDYIGGQPSSAPRTAPDAQAPQALQTPTATTTTADTAPTPTNSSSQATNCPNSSQDVDELETQQHGQHQPRKPNFADKVQC
ncbi:hypothetical protein Tco_0104445 [Tanacetum coccineum]